MNRVKALRDSFGKTIRDVEAETGITRSTLQRIEAEIGEPSYYSIERLADYYKVSVDYLMMHDVKPNDSLVNDETRKAVEARLEIQRLIMQLPTTTIQGEKPQTMIAEARLPKKRNDQKARDGAKSRIRYKVKG